MNRIQADALIDKYAKESKIVHFQRIHSLESGTNPIKSYIDVKLFNIKCFFKIQYLKKRRYFMWRKIRKWVKEEYPYYLSRHFYTTDNSGLFVVKPYRFLYAVEGAILSFQKGDDNYKIMLENDKKSKKFKRYLYTTMLDRFVYVNIFVMVKTIEITQKLTKKKIEYLLKDESKSKDNING